ncbi:MAG: hypothetical protein NTY08_16205 [Proteobacteria bacterium]|jgi:hypothetical protein|nr:hypothetical protein [Pseudomonadota bacterium]
MTSGYSRRGFIQSTVAVAAVLPVTHVSLAFFNSAMGKEWMIIEVMHHYWLAEADRGVVVVFVDRLQEEKYLQTESAAFIRDLWSKGRVARDQLATYLVQEFAVTTNVVAYRAREAAALEWTGHVSAVDDNWDAKTSSFNSNLVA